MKTTEILQAWKTILAGRAPSLSIEITKECPLSCLGCYAYGSEHLPLHISIDGGEPLVRFRELNEILPQLDKRRIRTHVVTSAVREIPREWQQFKQVKVIVSVDGLAPEHDERRKPATYTRILKGIEGRKITIHCTVTRQMTERAGYLAEFVTFWSQR